MKRRILALLLAVLTLTMLTAAAFAADTLGVFNVRGPLTVLNGTQDGSFYANADTFELNCTGLTGEYSLVLLLEGDSKVPTSSNIQYIDQLTVENDGTAKFTLRPKALMVGTYHIYVSTSDKALEEIASFAYGEEPEYTLGDVNGDGKFTSADALWALQGAVEARVLTGKQFMAADVDGNGKLTSKDALKILQYAIGKITTFD